MADEEAIVNLLQHREFVRASQCIGKVPSPLAPILHRFCQAETLFYQWQLQQGKRQPTLSSTYSTLYDALCSDTTTSMPTVPLTAAAAEMMTNLGTMLMKCIRVRRAMVAALMTMRETSPNALSFDILASSLSTGTDPNEYERVGTPCYVEQEMMVLEHLMLVQSALDRYDFKVVALSMHLAGQALKRVEVDIGLLQQENGTRNATAVLCRPAVAWFRQFHTLLHEKASILFHRVIRHCSPDTPKRTNESLLLSLLTQSVEQDKTGIVVVYYEISPSITYSSLGYSCEREEVPTGIHSFPILFHHPPQYYKENMMDWSKPDPICFFDRKMNTTYFMARIGRHQYVSIVRTGKHDRSSQTFQLLSLFVSKFRNTDQFMKIDRSM